MDSNASRAGEVERKVWRDNDFLLPGKLLKMSPLVDGQSAVSTLRKWGIRRSVMVRTPGHTASLAGADFPRLQDRYDRRSSDPGLLLAFSFAKTEEGTTRLRYGRNRAELRMALRRLVVSSLGFPCPGHC
jgi:hypothetical protein